MQIPLRWSVGLSLLVALPCAPVAAQDVFICAQTDMVLTRATDQNGSGRANDPGEYGKVGYAPTLLRTGQEVKATSMFGVPSLLWFDNHSSVRGLVKLSDTNGNGTFEPAETTALFTSVHTTLGITATNTFLLGMVPGTGDEVFFANNAFKAVPPATNGLYRAGSLTTTPVFSATIQQSNTVTIYENSTTPSGTTTQGGAWERIARIDSSKTILAYHTLDDVIYALTDLDMDGKFTSAGEVVNWLNAAGHKLGIAVNPDFAAGPLAGYGANFASVTPNSTLNYLTFNYIEVHQASNTVYVGTRTQPNAFLEPVSGKIFRCNDLNGNGTVNDPGEVVLYVNDFLAGTFVDQDTLIQYSPSASSPGFTGLAVDQSTGKVYALSNAGPADPAGTFSADMVWTFVDNDFDTVALSPGEQLVHHIQLPAGGFSNELEVSPAGFFAPTFAASSQHEVAGFQSPIINPGCTVIPSLALKTSTRFYKGPPFLGNTDWQVSLVGTTVSPGNTFAQLWVSEADWDPVTVKSLWDLLNGPPFNTGLPYPSNLSTRNIDEWLPIGFWMSPSPMYLDLFDLALTGTFWVENIPGGIIKGDGGVAGAGAYGDPIMGSCTAGAGSMKYIGRFDADIAVPSTVSLAGKKFRLQWHTQDSSGGGGLPRVVSDVGIIQLQ